MGNAKIEWHIRQLENKVPILTNWEIEGCYKIPFGVRSEDASFSALATLRPKGSLRFPVGVRPAFPAETGWRTDEQDT